MSFDENDDSKGSRRCSGMDPNTRGRCGYAVGHQGPHVSPERVIPDDLDEVSDYDDLDGVSDYAPKVRPPAPTFVDGSGGGRKADPVVYREGVASAMSAVGSKGAEAVLLLGASVMTSAVAFEDRCKRVAALLDQTARDLADQAEETLKMIEAVTGEVERLQGQAIETSTGGLRKSTERAKTEGA